MFATTTESDAELPGQKSFVLQNRIALLASTSSPDSDDLQLEAPRSLADRLALLTTVVDESDKAPVGSDALAKRLLHIAAAASDSDSDNQSQGNARIMVRDISAASCQSPASAPLEDRLAHLSADAFTDSDIEMAASDARMEIKQNPTDAGALGSSVPSLSNPKPHHYQPEDFNMITDDFLNSLEKDDGSSSQAGTDSDAGSQYSS